MCAVAYNIGNSSGDSKGVLKAGRARFKRAMIADMVCLLQHSSWLFFLIDFLG
jgi:hypothetical protein